MPGLILVVFLQTIIGDDGGGYDSGERASAAAAKDGVEMKGEIEIPDKPQPWVQQNVHGLVILTVDPSLADIRYTDQHEVTITTKR